ncbi:MAG: penicillin-insensitive murein endopeptidase [Enhygromyxa sp.]
MSEAPRETANKILAASPRATRQGRASRAALLAFALAGLPLTVGAAPPTDGLGDLPSLDELPDIEPASTESPPAADDEQDEEPAEKKPAEKKKSSEKKSSEKKSAEKKSAEKKPSEKKPAEPKLAIKKLSKPKWIKHVVIPGERLGDIATRYDVRTASLIRWNKIDPDKPRIYAGRELAVYTKHIPPPQQKIIYTVKYGDTWAKIASAYRVDADQLRTRWNPKVPRAFKAGQEIVIWVDPLSDPNLLADPAEDLPSATAGTSATLASATPAAALPLIAIPKNSISVGAPNKGKIVNSVALPENKQLYTLRKPDESFGSTHALHNLQLAIAQWRQASGYSGALLIGAISKKGGGRLRPHSSHQSGRDVDIRLPLERPDGSADNVNDVDWDATWSLILALVGTGEVEYIFLTTDRQKHLLKAAKRAGASKDLIERILQYPETRGNKNGIVRNQKGHTAHIHVRFTCAANETRCETY